MMPKSTNLQQTLWDLQKRFGDQAIGTLGARGTSATALATRFPELDTALGAGGIPDRGLTELIGVPTSGMTTLALRIAASAHADGAPVVYLDGAGTFDPDYAARCGVDPDRLLLVQPEDAAQALLIARDCARTNSVRLIVLDLVGLPVRSSKPL
ncbi:MAG: DNA recombination/repair protein RecA, partial [Candidatus Accumulibacter sp.]|nr:DNA recombination/repair protein RecA [Accumulibacter sp.]